MSLNATDNCDASVEITGYDCFEFTKNGKPVDKKDSCVMAVTGDTITVLDTGSVGTQITWTIRAEDPSGNFAEVGCDVEVLNPDRRP